MALRWRKDSRSSRSGSTLYLDCITRLAVTQESGSRPGSWFWVAGLGSPYVPHKNTWQTPVSSEKEAKDAAMAYVKKSLQENIPPKACIPW